MAVAIPLRCRWEEDVLSLAAERAHGVDTAGTEATGAVAIGTTGAGIGTITITITIIKSSLSVTLAFHCGGAGGIPGGAGAIRTGMDMVIRPTAMADMVMIMVSPAMDRTEAMDTVAMAMEATPGWPNCNVASLVPAIIMAQLTESWGQRHGEPFAPTSATAVTQADWLTFLTEKLTAVDGQFFI